MTMARGAASLLAQLESGLEESQLAGLDGMRAIAAFLVVFYHFGILLVSGGSGVLMFFVLSGFLITNTTRPARSPSASSTSAGRYVFSS